MYKNMYCICCKENKVKPYSIDEVNYGDTDPSNEEEMLWLKGKSPNHNKNTVGVGIRVDADYTINNLNVNDGIIQTISAGYGSRHDTDIFIISICDECISREVEGGNLLYWGSYLSPGNRKVKEKIEKSKKLYRRRKNLDELI